MGQIAHYTDSVLFGTGLKLLLSANKRGALTSSTLNIERQPWHVKRFAVWAYDQALNAPRLGVVPRVIICKSPSFQEGTDPTKCAYVNVSESTGTGPAEARDFYTDYGIYLEVIALEAGDIVNVACEYEVL